MAHKYILDAHALIWYLEGSKRLSRKARGVMADPDSQLVLPIIALAEATFIIERGRTTIPDVSQFLRRVEADARIEIIPLTTAIFKRSLTPEGLRIPELHDRFIVSTGLHLQDLGDTVEIITTDQLITSVRVVPVLW
jgi:PIN domain nuclease of toxin-antitoxin system